MSREEIQKLLSAYATGTLDAAERRALFEAALDDQELFDTLAKEEALREVLDDPAARRQLIVALGPRRESVGVRLWRWVRQPAGLALAGSLAAALIGAGFALYQSGHVQRPVLVADARAPKNEPVAPAPASPPVETPAEHQRHAIGRPAPAAPRAAPSAKKFLPPAGNIAAPSPALPPPPPLPAEEATQASAPLAGARAFTVAPPAITGSGGTGAGQITSRNRPAIGGGGFYRRLPGAMATTSGPHATAKAASPMRPSPIRYAWLRKDADGAYVAVPFGAAFQVGDAVRLRLESSAIGFVYVLLRRDPAAAWTLLENRRVEASQPYEVPSIGGFTSDAPAHWDLILLFSRVEQTLGPAELAASAGANATRLSLEFR